MKIGILGTGMIVKDLLTVLTNCALIIFLCWEQSKQEMKR